MATEGAILLDQERIQRTDTVTLSYPWYMEEHASQTFVTYTSVEDGRAYLVLGGGTLYRPSHADAGLELAHVTFRFEYQVESTSGRWHGTLRYVSGIDRQGREVLVLDDRVWVRDDNVVAYGPDDLWLARASTPTRGLVSYPQPATRSPESAVGWLAWLAFTALLTLGGLELLWKRVGFLEAFWIFGFLACLKATLSSVNRTELVLASSFGLWLVTKTFASPLIAQPAFYQALPRIEGAHHPETALALAALTLAMLGNLGTHRGFHVVARGLALGAVGSLLACFTGMLVVAMIDGFEWFEWFFYYFYDLPYAALWPAISLATTAYVYRDHANAAQSYASFQRLMHDLLGRMRSPQPLWHAKAMGRCFDDLADGLRMSLDPRLQQLYGYHSTLERLERVFKRLGKDQRLQHALLARHGERMSRDLALMAIQLESMAPDGPAILPSPLLTWLTRLGVDHGTYLRELERADRAA